MMPPFDTPVPPGGYRWWYLDALSDDGRHGITLIAFNLAARIAPAQSGRLIAMLTTAYGLGQILGPLLAGFIAGEGGGSKRDKAEKLDRKSVV